MRRVLASLALWCVALGCGSSGPSSEPTELATARAMPLCEAPAPEAIDFGAAAEADSWVAVASGDVTKVENIALGLGHGSHIDYARWGPDDRLLVAVSGCEAGSCRAGVVLIERNEHGFFVKRKDTAVPSIHGSSMAPEWIFVADFLGDETPELWIVSSSRREQEDTERRVAVYSTNGLSLLWSAVWTADSAGCQTEILKTDIDCDDKGEVAARRSCPDASPDVTQYHWQGNRLRDKKSQ